MSYQEAVKYLESFINYEKIPVYPYKESLKLERIKDFLSVIDNPQDSLKCIHVAGSKGKGSTCVFVTYILREAGYKVGLYTSPHLSDFRERIRILKHRLQKASGRRCPIGFANKCPLPTGRQGLDLHPVQDDFEGMILKDELAELVKRLKPDIESYNKKSTYGPLSFFEVYTALAFVYFKEQKVDFAVLETGLGGRLDATNVVDPLAVAITPISYEHTQKLGNTLKEIATEKVGIIKMGYGIRDTGYKALRYPLPVTRYPIVISAPQEEEAAEVIRQRCKEAEAKLYEVGRDIFYKKTRDGFNVMGIQGEYKDLKTRLLGDHQLMNAAVAVGMVEALGFFGIHIETDSIRKGLYNTIWPGRCEIISRKPLVILDGAQNTSSVGVLKKTIKENFKYNKLILVLGISNDKDKKGICSQLYGLADRVILTKADNPRATEPKILAEYFKEKGTYITDNVSEAKKLALKIAGEKDLILVTGSLFIIGEFRDGKTRP